MTTNQEGTGEGWQLPQIKYYPKSKDQPHLPTGFKQAA